MTRLEFEDRICAVRKELKYLEAVKPGCTACDHYDKNTCKLYGQIPADFVEIGCDQWEFMDTPF